MKRSLAVGLRGGKRGRGAEGKRPVLIAVERRAKNCTGLIAMAAVDRVNRESVQRFRPRLGDELRIRTDAFPRYGLLALEQGLQVESRVTPPEKVDDWLPLVHTAIANLKQFLLGTFHEVSAPKLQKYLDKFAYRFSRRFWEAELSDRLLVGCTNHEPIPAKRLYNENLVS